MTVEILNWITGIGTLIAITVPFVRDYLKDLKKEKRELKYLQAFRCPQCHRAMDTKHTDVTVGFIVNTCKYCGYYFYHLTDKYYKYNINYGVYIEK